MIGVFFRMGLGTRLRYLFGVVVIEFLLYGLEGHEVLKGFISIALSGAALIWGAVSLIYDMGCIGRFGGWVCMSSLISRCEDIYFRLSGEKSIYPIMYSVLMYFNEIIEENRRNTWDNASTTYLSASKHLKGDESATYQRGL
ncbi:hypothetical protein CCACVL1_29641 [Corchorus capsularis]|uniref:Uncharacterized protein n=1 Tax=Corchorus capsularis TaxID=210143 RepID=A0A1R3G0U0_COCAP|nr:hypothetical protein CCACVL1_29641 [Corchorus capsularis]